MSISLADCASKEGMVEKWQCGDDANDGARHELERGRDWIGSSGERDQEEHVRPQDEALRASLERERLAASTAVEARGAMHEESDEGAEHHGGGGGSTTFYKSVQISLREPVGSMSISPANRDVVLAARKGLFIVDLENPYEPPRFLAHASRWQVADCQWNPHPARAQWVASTSNQKLLVWNLDRPEMLAEDAGAFSIRSMRPTRTGSYVSRHSTRPGTTTGASGFVAQPSYHSPSLSSSARGLTTLTPFSHDAILSGAGRSVTSGNASVAAASNILEPRRIWKSSSVEYVLHAHTRGITDINWSPFHPDVLASCGIDSWTWAWDLRDPSRPKQGYSAWNAAATQVKWNRASPHRLATSCDNKVLIWDDRKGALPLATIEAHESKIYGIDWARDATLGLDRIITCSLAGSVKYWDLSSNHAQRAIGKRELVTEPEQTIETPTPVWRARHLPFGSGVMTLPQRGDTSLSMWHKSNPETPVKRFEGHKDTVKEFLYRTRGGSDRQNDDREWQLLTWAKDQTLRLWPIDPQVTRAVGHVAGGPIKVLYTRVNAPNISYRDPPPIEAGAPSGCKSVTDQPQLSLQTQSLGEAHTRVLSAPENIFVRSPASATAIQPPLDATAALLSGPGSRTRTRLNSGGPSPLATSTGGNSGASGSASASASAFGTSFSRHARSFSERTGRENAPERSSWNAPLSESLPRSQPRSMGLSGANMSAPRGGTMTAALPQQTISSRSREVHRQRTITEASSASTTKGNSRASRDAQAKLGSAHLRASADGRKTFDAKHAHHGEEREGKGRSKQGESTAGRRSRAKAPESKVYMTRGAGVISDAAWLAQARTRAQGTAGQNHTLGSKSTIDAIGWISGVKVSGGLASQRRERSPTSKRDMSKSLTAGREDHLDKSIATLTPDRSTEAGALAQLRGVPKEGTSIDGSDADVIAPDAAQILGEEVSSISKRMPRVTFEKVEIAQRVICCNLYGPWGVERGQPAFLRITFNYPSSYPSKAPRFDLENHASVPLKTRALLLRSVKKLLRDHAATRRIVLDQRRSKESGSEDNSAANSENEEEQSELARRQEGLDAPASRSSSNREQNDGFLDDLDVVQLLSADFLARRLRTANTRGDVEGQGRGRSGGASREKEPISVRKRSRSRLRAFGAALLEPPAGAAHDALSSRRARSSSPAGSRALRTMVDHHHQVAGTGPSVVRLWDISKLLSSSNHRLASPFAPSRLATPPPLLRRRSSSLPSSPRTGATQALLSPGRTPTNERRDPFRPL
ncbi:Conserved WD40 repeat-containing protein [Ceraceosorus bombacis]|uniref:Conserved WD40 repeat-containing protein n=1 Tax=Ceraceosorus bombacis TaxID=401625 RepID=A0A0P1B7M9_9BASI|nr:Conserved WD40 repeat-containing protein [Ceraceosorus bombacis]